MRKWTDNLRDVMQERGVNQADIARHLGCVPSTVSHWFTGRAMPSVPTLKRVAAYLGVAVTDIIKDDALITRDDDERQLIELMRELTEQQRSAALAMIRAMRPDPPKAD